MKRICTILAALLPILCNAEEIKIEKKAVAHTADGDTYTMRMIMTAKALVFDRVAGTSPDGIAFTILVHWKDEPAFAEVIEKYLSAYDQAEKNKLPAFEKPLGKIGAEEFSFKWPGPGKGTSMTLRRGSMYPVGFDPLYSMDAADAQMMNAFLKDIETDIGKLRRRLAVEASEDLDLSK
jgi:hypothetical protein